MKEFQINIHRLINGSHDFDFKIFPDFFKNFSNSVIEKGQGHVQVTLDKSETMMVLHMNMDVTVELICDISLDKYDFPVQVEQDLMIKFGEENREISEEMIQIDRDAQHINIADVVYEYLSINIPMKKVHPKLANQDRPDLIYASSEEDHQEDPIDPRWEALKKLKK